jgi:Rps23 Pro-64 3,4-dihydroxylase Tpa1-like proline 4-hydroxylase
VPTHKKGGTFSYSTIRELAPAIADFYHSDDLREFISRTVGVGVKCTPQHDQSSLSVLVYDRPGDHIAWHYDHNFYRGRHFTVLLPVVNVGSCAGGLSHAQLVVKAGETDRTIQAAANTLVVFEGAKVLHKVTPVQADERRIVVSMTFCQDPRTTTLRGAARRIKDTAFFGMRALWM